LAVVSSRRAAGGKTARRARGSLSAEEILDAAQVLVERDGLGRLSMPLLAKELRSGVTSIYWYFRSKDELLAALTERVSREVSLNLPPIGDRPWDEELVEYFAAFRELLERSAVYREVFAYHPRALLTASAMAPAVLARLEAGLRLLVDAGFSGEDAADAYQACTTYTEGYVLLELGGDPSPESRPVQVDPDRYPILASLGPYRFDQRGDAQFRDGLRLILDGLQRRRSTAPPSPGPRNARR